MSKTYEQIVQELDAKIPRDVVSTREGGGGRKLSYLEGWYVIDRLNKVLGAGNWAYSSEANLLHQGTVPSRSGDTYSVHYSAKVRLVVTIGEVPTEFTDYGYGDGTDKTNPGKAHELAIKEAITDGLKRCAKNLGMSFGLALYDKTQENVEENANETVIKPSVAEPVRSSGKVEEAKSSNVFKDIRTSRRVAILRKRTTAETLATMLKTKYNVENEEQLSPVQANQFLNELKEMTNG